jgi:Ca-activated chloride channel family protein
MAGSFALKRAFAVSAVVLATGGLVLYKTPLLGQPSRVALADGKHSVTFGGPGARGVLALSHTHVLAGTRTPVYAELRLVADSSATANVRAPLSLAVVLDTSGSMEGAKLEDAKRSVLRLLSDMRDEDEITVVRYSDSSELIQPLARLGDVRSSLSARVSQLQAGGGTDIPSGLSRGLQAIEETGQGRVRRIVLVSDGLDNTRAKAEALARRCFSTGVVVSSLGIGLDFDERYMGSVAQNGHGNFAFIKDGDSLAGFLRRELDQTAATTIVDAQVRLDLPPGLRFVSATGAESTVSGTSVDLRHGSLFAGDERRVIVALEADGSGSSELHASASWKRVASDGAQSEASISVPTLTLLASTAPSEVERGRDGAVLASATSVIASRRQLEAGEAYARGDVARATTLTSESERELGAALAVAPAAAAPTIAAQLRSYGELKKELGASGPSSAASKTAAKAGAAKDLDNLSRAARF